jgi:hypothetical protein
LFLVTLEAFSDLQGHLLVGVQQGSELTLQWFVVAFIVLFDSFL